MLSSQQRIIDFQSEKQRKLRALYLSRFQEHRIKLQKYRESGHFRELPLNDYIITLNSLMDVLTIPYNWANCAPVLLDETILSSYCTQYDQFIGNIIAKENEEVTRAHLRNAFEERIISCTLKLLEITASLDEKKDTLEIKCINNYLTELKNIRDMLCQRYKPLYTDESTLNKDCAFLEELIKTYAPRVMEGKARRAIFQKQDQRLNLRFTDLMHKLPNDKQLQVYRDNYNSFARNLYNNSSLNADQFDDYFKSCEQFCAEREQLCEETPQVKKFGR